MIKNKYSVDSALKCEIVKKEPVIIKMVINNAFSKWKEVGYGNISQC